MHISISIATQIQVLLYDERKRDFNPHMHKLGPRGPTQYIFGD